MLHASLSLLLPVRPFVAASSKTCLFIEKYFLKKIKYFLLINFFNGTRKFKKSFSKNHFLKNKHPETPLPQ
jgi:hypothetical protein